jgi:hypothetical protein
VDSVSGRELESGSAGPVGRVWECGRGRGESFVCTNFFGFLPKEVSLSGIGLPSDLTEVCLGRTVTNNFSWRQIQNLRRHCLEPCQPMCGSAAE